LGTVNYHLGFDLTFDQSAASTREKMRERVGLSVAVLVVSFIAIGPIAFSWWGVSILAEGMVWWATSPDHMRRNPVRARGLRVAASAVASCAWVVCAMLLWTTATPVSDLLAIGLLAAIALYIISACHETPIHLIAAGTPPALALLGGPQDRILLALSILLLVSFGTSSAVRAYRTHTRLMESGRLLENQTHQAQAANRAKSDFLANISHEIRTPLNGVLAISDALSQTRLTASQKDMLGLVLSSGKVLERLLSDLLDLARIESTRIELHTAPFDLGKAVTDVVQLHAPLGESKGLSVILDLDPAIDGQVLGDLVRFKQVLTNLISNAIKFTHAGQVTVTGRRDPDAGSDGFLFSVEDTGIGFIPENSDRLFKRFEQEDGSITRQFGGSGLGLFICRQLTELMQGRIACESEPGRGSKFTLHLQLKPLQVADVIEPEPVPLTGRLRVLAADDHPTNRRVIELILSQAPVDLVLVEDGSMAVAAVGTQAFDLIFMDMQMPVMDGLAATRAIRRLEVDQSRTPTPIIMLTANVLPEHIEQSLAAGANRHIGKPISAAVLLETLGTLAQASVAKDAA
jgi:signal transduction histidine kinase/CheY-like chemotaxis protein